MLSRSVVRYSSHDPSLRVQPRLSAIVACLLTLSSAVACSKSSSTVTAGAGAGTAEQASVASVPFEVRDDTPDLLLTWIDDQGDFHVVQTVAEVPETNRAQVRVVNTTKDEGAGQTVLVADLRTKDATGSYPVVAMERSRWNELGADKRKVRMEALAPKAATTGEASPAADSKGSAATGTVRAVIYGASWCKPCHDAEALLKKLGVDVVKKDIEESRAAQAEMQQRLAEAGRGGASIPVIDVAGQLFVGFEPRQLTAAVERARAGQAKPTKM